MFFWKNNNLIKSKDFLEEIINSEVVKNEIRIEAERRLNRKFSDLKIFLFNHIFISS